MRIRKVKLPEQHQGPFVSGKYDRDMARLYLKRDSGEYQIVSDVYPAMFVKPKDVENLPQNNRFLLGYKIESDNYARIILAPDTTRSDVDDILHECFDRKIYPLEADVDPVRRWFSDTGAEVALKTKALFFDLETFPLIPGFSDDAKKMHRVISFAAGDIDGNFWFEYNDTLDDAGEARLIEKFLKLASRYHTLLAWNGKDYDDFVLRWRCKHLNIYVDWRDWNQLDYMLTVKKCLMSISDKSYKRSYALDNIGYNVLGIHKLELDIDKGRLDRLISESRTGELRAYNGRDVEIMIKLETAREFLNLHATVCRLCRNFQNNNSIYSNQLGDGLILRQAVIEDRHFRSRFSSPEDEDEGKYAGAYVMDSIVGFHKKVQVIDFASLYPSIIISFNMSPETKIRSDWNYPNEVLESASISPSTQTRFRTDIEGIVPRVLYSLLDTRKIYAKKQKDAEVGSEEWKRFGNESTAVKVISNSLYGLIGSRYTRYHDREIAESITQTAQYLIQAVIKHVQDNFHLEVIHADTDSAFVKVEPERVQEIVEDINSNLIQQIAREHRCRKVTIKIDSDKGYHYLLMQTKKKYAGVLCTYKGKPAPEGIEPEIKGLEYQRPDIIPFAQSMQMHFLKRVLDPHISPIDIEVDLQRWAERFMSEKIDLRDIEIYQAVKKQPKEYKSQTPAVRAAQILIDHKLEFFVGMKVGYVIVRSTKDGTDVVPSELFDGKFDRNYYWINKVIGPTARILRARFLDHQFALLDSLETEPRQSILQFDSTVQKKLEEKLPKVRRVRTVGEVVQPVTLIIDEKDDATDNTVVGISKLAEVANGSLQLRFRIITKQGEATIKTNNFVGEDFLREVTKLFSWVKVERHDANDTSKSSGGTTTKRIRTVKI